MSIDWQEPVHGQLDLGDELADVTFKDGLNPEGAVTDTLIARGWVDDIQRDVDHVHAWNQDVSEMADHHDMRRSDPLFPDTPGLF